MPTIDVVVESELSNSIRVRQVSSMFDVPPQEKCRLEWHADLPIEVEPWNVGLVVGPSGSGKSTIARHLWGEPVTHDWSAASVVDGFGAASVEDIAGVCQAVGFNTIPAWLRPYHVLSNGERFRVDLARHLLSNADPVVVDEFTSVVDRQVAKIGSHAVQKYVRKHGRKFVAVTCHYDVVDWLQPDWVFDVSTNQFQRRLLQRRPPVECVVGPVPYAAWRMFAPYHYLSADLNRSARCFGLWCEGKLAAFAGLLIRPTEAADVYGVSRLVTLPDWQGLGLAFVLTDTLGAEYRAAGLRLRVYPAHPSLVRGYDRSPRWKLVKRPGKHSTKSTSSGIGSAGGRPCAVFEYVGSAAESCVILQRKTPHPGG